MKLRLHAQARWIKLLLLAAVVLAPAWFPQANERFAMLLTVDGAIGPATSDYIRRGIESGHEQGDALVIIKMDTPGGLDSAMRDIIQHILVSPLPVATSGTSAFSKWVKVAEFKHDAV